MEPLQQLRLEFVTYWESLLAKSPHIATAIIVVLVMHVILKILRVRLIKVMRNKADDKILVDFTHSIFRFVNMIILALLFLYIIGFGNIAGSILGAAGISAFVIGFALKDIGENFLAGVIMAFDRPFRLGDTIKSGEVEGVITRLSLRDTHVKTFDGKDVYVPNGQIIKNPLYNYTMDGYMRHNFTVGVDYGADIEQARTIILDTIKSIPGILTDQKPPRTHVKNLNTSTIDIECHFWIDTFDSNYSGLELKSIAQSKTITALTDAQVGMPADIIEVKNYDEAINMISEQMES